MIVQLRPQQQIDSLWHELECQCPEGHKMAPTRIEVSRYGNMRLAWVCVHCGKSYIEIRNFVDLINSSNSFDMLYCGDNNVSEPLIVNLEEKVV